MGRSKPEGQVGRIENRILLIRSERVIVDADLAQLYGVTTKALNQQVGRNPDRFPEDFAFRLSAEEKAEVVTKCDHIGNLKYSHVLPYVFTEHGALMAANVLKSTRAVEMSLFVVRAFVRLRQAIEQQREIVARLGELESKLSEHDIQILSLVRVLKQLAGAERIPSRRQIGFGKREP